MTCEAFREDMMDVLYGEAAPEVGRRFAEHHDQCQACRQELRDLKGVRRELGDWSLPAPARLGVPGRRAALPSWLPLAATVLLSVGVSVLLARGPLRAAPPASDTSSVTLLLAALEQRHRQEIAQLRAALDQRAAVMDETTVLRRAQELIRESETRQGLVLQARLADLATRTEAQRRYDIAQMTAGLTYLDGKTGLQAARTTELVGQILQASAKR